MARPKAKIDWKKVDSMLMAGCTGTECAAFFGIHEDTLYRACERDQKKGFAAYSQEKRSKGDILLRQAQFDMALKKDRGMLIWLGKNRLGQKDTPDVPDKERKADPIKLNIGGVDVEIG